MKRSNYEMIWVEDSFGLWFPYWEDYHYKQKDFIWVEMKKQMKKLLEMNYPNADILVGSYWDVEQYFHRHHGQRCAWKEAPGHYYEGVSSDLSDELDEHSMKLLEENYYVQPDFKPSFALGNAKSIGTYALFYKNQLVVWGCENMSIVLTRLEEHQQQKLNAFPA